MDFRNRLDSVIREQVEAEPVSQVQESLLDLAAQLRDQISDLKIKITDSEKQLSHIIEQLNANLGIAIRKRQPKLSIGHHNGKCSCGYKSRDLICTPDFEKKIWVVDGRLGRGFKRTCPKALGLSTDVDPLADAIVDYFRRYFRSLY